MGTPLVSVDVNQGATFSTTFVMNTSDGAAPPVLTPIDLSGCTARMMIRASYASNTPLVTLTTENGGITLGGISGTILVKLTPQQTLQLPVKVPTNYSVKNGPPSEIYVGDLDVIFTDGEVRRYLNLAFTVYATVTK